MFGRLGAGPLLHRGGGDTKIERGGVTGARVRGVEHWRALWHEVMHPEHKLFSVVDKLEHERAQGRS